MKKFDYTDADKQKAYDEVYGVHTLSDEEKQLLNKSKSKDDDKA